MTPDDRSSPHGPDPDHVVPAANGWHEVQCWPDGADPRVVPPPGAEAEHRPCLWCSFPMTVTRRPGRPRLYCRRSCRQRAYERRSGLGVLPPVERRSSSLGAVVPATSPRPKAYEAGMSRTGVIRHAMRPAGRPDRFGRWTTLCGVDGRPTGRPFAEVDPRSCHTCVEIQHHRPPGEPFAPSPRLAALRAVLDDAGVWLDRRDRWMRGTWRGDAEPAVEGSFGDVLSTAELVQLLVAAAA